MSAVGLGKGKGHEEPQGRPPRERSCSPWAAGLKARALLCHWDFALCESAPLPERTKAGIDVGST